MDGSVERTTDAKDGTSQVKEDASAKPKLGRISVNVTPATQAALERVVDREGVTMTEALRRLVGYGDLVYETTQIHSDDLLIRRGDAVERIHLV
jgi:hypothetical protein